MYLASSIDERKLLERYKKREVVTFCEQEKIIYQIREMSSVLLSASRLRYLSKIEEVLPLLNEQWNKSLPYFETIKTRSFNIRMLYNRYIDNIQDIDYSILNFYDLNFMFRQVRSILSSSKTRKKATFPPVFMVCAAPSSGKATLMEIVGDLGNINNNITITKKYARRGSRSTDGRDGMIAIGKNGKFENHISNKDDIWKWSFHNSVTEYAVSHSEIKDNIQKNIAQIFISNMEQIENARIFYPDNIVVLYLHATHESKTREHIEKKRTEEVFNGCDFFKNEIVSLKDTDQILNKYPELRTNISSLVENDMIEIKNVHDAFCKHNTNIDHVLLNTGTREDLVEQMINIEE